MSAADKIPTHRLAIALSMAASDLDIEALMRQPESEKAAVVTVLACGLRRDTLRVPPLLGIAHDRRWPKAVRIAARKSLGMIAGPTSADGLRTLVPRGQGADVTQAARRAQRRARRAAQPAAA